MTDAAPPVEAPSTPQAKEVDVTAKAKEVLQDREEALRKTALSEKKIEEARKRKDAHTRKVMCSTMTPTTLVTDGNNLHPLSPVDKGAWKKQWASTDPTSVMASYEQLGSALQHSKEEERKSFLEDLKKREAEAKKREDAKAKLLEEQRVIMEKNKAKEMEIQTKVAANRVEEMHKCMVKHEAKMEKGKKLAEEERKKKEDKIKAFQENEDRKMKVVHSKVAAADKEFEKKVLLDHKKREERREAKDFWSKKDQLRNQHLQSSMDKDTTIRHRNKKSEDEFEKKCYEDRVKILVDTQKRAEAALKGMEAKSQGIHAALTKAESDSQRRLETIWKKDEEKAAAICARMAKKSESLERIKAEQAKQARERQERQRVQIKVRAVQEDLLLTAQITKKVDPFNTLAPVPPPEG